MSSTIVGLQASRPSSHIIGDVRCPSSILSSFLTPALPPDAAVAPIPPPQRISSTILAAAAELQKISPAEDAPAEEAPPAPIVKEALPNCVADLQIQPPKDGFERYLELTWLDNYYLNLTNMPYQCIGFRFQQALDPTLVLLALMDTMQKFPVVGSRVEEHEGVNKFHFAAEQIVLSLALVGEGLLLNLACLEEIASLLAPNTDADPLLAPLFRCTLFRTRNSALGSALVACFRHTVGDAASYAMFLVKVAPSLSLPYPTLIRHPQSPNPHPPTPPTIRQGALLFAHRWEGGRRAEGGRWRAGGKEHSAQMVCGALRGRGDGGRRWRQWSAAYEERCRDAAAESQEPPGSPRLPPEEFIAEHCRFLDPNYHRTPQVRTRASAHRRCVAVPVSCC